MSAHPARKRRTQARGQDPATAAINAPGAVVEWIGASGTGYSYWAYELPEVPDQAAIGSYVFARKGDDGQWAPIFFGHGDLATLGEGVHALWAGLRAKGATHVHTHRSARLKARMAEEADLLAAYPQAFAPQGCNPPPDRDEDDAEAGPAQPTGDGEAEAEAGDIGLFGDDET